LPPEDEALKLLESLFLKGTGPASEQVQAAVHDSYKRLLYASMETEIRLATKKQADEKAIRVFVENLRQLLTASGKRLAIDPGTRVYLNQQETAPTYYLSFSRKAWRSCEKMGYLHVWIETIAIEAAPGRR
jgi:hypothetical protein